MDPLRVIDKQKDEEVKLYKMILDLMSYEKVVITGMFLLKADFQLRLYVVLCVSFCVLGHCWLGDGKAIQSNKTTCTIYTEAPCGSQGCK